LLITEILDACGGGWRKGIKMKRNAAKIRNTAKNTGSNMLRQSYIRFIAEAAVIAALYAALTILIPGGSGQIQIRVAEALTVMASFTPAAVPGLFIGCLTANIVVGFGIYDIIFGSIASLIAAYLTHIMPSRYLAPLPPVVVNAVIVAFVLNITLDAPILATMGFVALGEVIACYGLGYPLLLFLEKHKDRLFSLV
jgi:uncharacterized membrane protein